jgi:hypothetical protein
MKVDYDPEAKSLLFEFGEFRESEDGDHVDTYLPALDEAAERFELDAEGLKAAAHAALAAPNREIIIEVGRKLPLKDEEEPEEAKAA